MHGYRLALVIFLSAYIITASVYRLTDGKPASGNLSLYAVVFGVVVCAAFLQWNVAACQNIPLYYPQRATLLTLLAVSKLYKVSVRPILLL